MGPASQRRETVGRKVELFYRGKGQPIGPGKQTLYRGEKKNEGTFSENINDRGLWFSRAWQKGHEGGDTNTNNFKKTQGTSRRRGKGLGNIEGEQWRASVAHPGKQQGKRTSKKKCVFRKKFKSITGLFLNWANPNHPTKKKSIPSPVGGHREGVNRWTSLKGTPTRKVSANAWKKPYPPPRV